jgi:hypothetical protein
VVADSVLELTRALRSALVSFQAEAHSGEDCAVLVEELAAIEKVSAATRVRAAARAGSCGAHRGRGFADVSDWMARATGSTAGAAKAALETATALESQPEAKAALDAGEISFAQARELVRTEAAVPGSTAVLLDMAKGQSLRALKDEGRDRRLRAIDPEELHALQHAAMHHRTWTTALGTIAYSGELPPEVGIPTFNRLDAETDRLWLKAHRGSDQQICENAAAGGAKADLRRSALAAQACVRMVENGGRGKASRADLVIVCDLQAYRRGHAHEGEPCHIVGGGPIPVSLAKDLSRDAFLKAVLHNGTEIHTVAHFGRRYPAVLQTALDLGAPPKFNGNVCAAPGYDRWNPPTSSGTTSTPSPTAAKPHTPTTNRSAHQTTGSRPKPTERPAYSARRGKRPHDRHPARAGP